MKTQKTLNTPFSYRFILIRHGESLWNQEGRFTGWQDIDLSEKGIREAKKAAQMIKKCHFHFSIAHTSLLKRAIRTLWILLDELDHMWIPIHSSWSLNERHYGKLQGMKKKEMEKKYGKEQVFRWRRNYKEIPPPLPIEDKNHPKQNVKYKNLKNLNQPFSESLEQTEKRLMPYWEKSILKTANQASDVLIVAHGNSLRALAKSLEGLSEQEISKYNILTGKPYVYELDEKFRLLRKYELQN